MRSGLNGNGAGLTNGHLSVYSSAASSPPPAPPLVLPIPQPPKALEEPSASTHNQTLVNHLYYAGFRNGNYADVVLQVPWRQYAAHALIISRSPYLAHVMSTSPSSSKTFVIPLEHEPHITPESFDIALSYLYSTASLAAIHPHNARAVLAAACFLGGMDELSNYAYQICLQSMSVETVMEWLDFIETIPTSDDATVPELPTVFGPYGKRLREDVFHFLAIALPTSLGAFPGSETRGTHVDAAGHDALLHIYSRLPFEFFKRALESTQFPLHGNHARFKFAKTAIALRKQKGVSRDTEETVVLAFDGQTDQENAVHITRKMRKKPLWKVTK